ncbi:aminoacyl-tRNA deacylase [Thioclava nitratireducens]|uniref:Cys-tRNA(Pro)/Cys-tRNA(Cys) deacylase n=1 Tax=Thioclava nitratireducens TaxID=1915078 RepID=A0ABM6IER8_9RHOB|nr:aminoacyl-tRNA deacylase [Thioclava nitratireducens]AQS47236.1 aminoacyl-tRNA deacylase [Thioclava nitratireducens]
MSTATPATRGLDKAKTAYKVREYHYDPSADRIGIAAAEALGVAPGLVLKTLMVEVDGKPAACVVPSDRTLSMKRVAAAFGGKSAAMMPPDRAERLTGFHTGGISPFGQKKRVPVVFEADTAGLGEVVINGGKRGMMVVIDVDAAITATGAAAKPLCAD